MESPPACSTWSEAFPSSEDSGLLLTSGHSGSVSSGSCGGALALEEESDDDDKSISTPESLSDGAAEDDEDDENFNTLKKGPGWPPALEPPPEFQDKPPTLLIQPSYIHKFASHLVAVLLEEALLIACKATWSIHCSQECHPGGLGSVLGEAHCNKSRWSGPRLCWTPELPPASANSGSARPSSHSSLASSRLSSSHNSLAVPLIHGDDSSAFITSAVSHDDISDLYNVPFDSDIYAVPVDVVRPSGSVPPAPSPPPPPPPLPHQRSRRHQHHHHHRKRRRHASSGSQSELERQAAVKGRVAAGAVRLTTGSGSGSGSKRHSVPSSVSGSNGTRQGCSTSSTEGRGVVGTEPVHMTLHEVRQYLQNLYSSSGDSIETRSKTDGISSVSIPKHSHLHPVLTSDSSAKSSGAVLINSAKKHKKNTFVITIKNKKAKELCTDGQKDSGEKEKVKKSPGRHSFSTNLKQTLCNIFRIRKPLSPDHHSAPVSVTCTVMASPEVECQAPKAPFLMRALPPLPAKSPEISGVLEVSASPEPVAPMPSPEDVPCINFEGEGEGDLEGEELSMDFAASIEKVKDYGWYWGPISGEAAEKVLSNEPDGSFIVRDSSDDHYIFSLTFKLNGCIRHVRIEHDQGNFSFGSCTKFKSHTIVDFIENAVEHSRSGRYLFFLHRRPVLGPMRVQLLHPVSRFKQVQSLQHMCRFVILKLVRRDLIPTLPLPRRLLDYLSTPHYYAEQLLDEEQKSNSLGPSPSQESVPPLAAFLPPFHSAHIP